VRIAAPIINRAAFDGLMLLQSTDQLKALFGELFTALESLAPAEPDHPRFAAHFRRAGELWNQIKLMDSPGWLDYQLMLENTLAAAISTQKAPDEAAPKESAAAFSPQALGNVYARRRGAGK
jgi:hypothetical protein